MSTETVALKLTVDQYERMGETGIFEPDDRVELIDGVIYQMAPIGVGHQWCVDTLTKLFMTRVAEPTVVRIQGPAVIRPYSEPEPDLQLLRGPSDRYRTAHPEPADVLLCIEVSETTVRFDRAVKLPIYARAGIPEVWIVNLQESIVEVYREPSPDGFKSAEVARGDASVSPFALPDVAITVSEIIP